VGVFRVAEVHDDDPHEFHILEPASSDWLQELANRYRALRTHFDLQPGEVTLDGITVLGTEALQRRIVEAAIPARRGGNFDVLRSDLGEMALAVHGEERYGYRYGYRSVRDRETVQLPGRGIDQIGVASTEDPQIILLVLGEAKVSAEKKSPPGVVDTSDDCLRAQHLHHIANYRDTANKVLLAARRCTDPETQELLLLASALLRDRRFEHLVLCCHSFVARPSLLAASSDYGTFRSAPADYTPSRVRFTILRLPGDDVEAIIDKFREYSLGPTGEQIEPQGEA
jgi:hypothetical protein